MAHHSESLNGQRLKEYLASVYIRKIDTTTRQFNRFPGNSVVCHLREDKNIAPFIYRLEQFKLSIETLLGNNFTWLPSDEWHVTVFDLVCHYIRSESRWFSDVELYASFVDVEKYVLKCVRGVIERYRDCSFTFKIKGMRYGKEESVVSVLLEPEGKTQSMLDALRFDLSEATGLSIPFKKYHVTLGYQNDVIAEFDVYEKIVQQLEEDIVAMDLTLSLYPRDVYFEDMAVMGLEPIYAH